MTTTFQKRQKEMKRMEKARAKAERREQKKLEPRTGNEISTDNGWNDVLVDDPITPDADLDAHANR